MAQTNFVLAEYVWLDGSFGLRSKTKVYPGRTSISLKELSEWNYDGSSTGQSPGEDSEVILKPAAVFHDPFRGGNNVLVMCDTYTPQGVALPTNTRAPAVEIFNKAKEEEPWFGIEQEYTMFKDGVPLGWPKSSARGINPTSTYGFPAAQGPYYCSAGADVSFGRDLVEDHMISCLKSGINVSGINAEVMPGQWEYQVGPCTGIESGDQLWMSRYILLRCSEKYGIVISFDPKPIPGDWNGAGCHTNYSTKKMREEDGSLDSVIIPMMKKLEAKHEEHIAVYGTGNEMRLTGKHETANMDTFLYGVANRGASIRIPNVTAQKKKGYFEDRRPASNMDPYVVTSKIFKTTIVD